MRIAVTGAGGMLGSALVEAARVADMDVVPIYRKWLAGLPTGLQVDLAAPDAMTALSATAPDLIVNCAAITDVDWCESHPAEAAAVNADMPGRIAQTAAQMGVPMVQISTDSVFDGRRGYYSEADAPNPLNVYASAKLAAEESVLSASTRHLVLRTSIFGWTPVQARRLGLASWLIRRLSAGETVPAFVDARFSPLYVGDLASLILRMTVVRLAGLYHIGSADAASKFDFAMLIAEAFELDASLVLPTSMDDASFLANRPRDTSLDSQKIAGQIGGLPTLTMAVRRMQQSRAAGASVRPEA